MSSNRVKAIPLYLDGSEAKHLYVYLDNFFKNECSNVESFTFVLGQSAWAEDTYLKILYEGLDDVATIVL